MEERNEARDSFDDFPTPCWATRALIEHVIMPEMATMPEVARMGLRRMSVLEPAANRGHMVKPLAEYFGLVVASDIFDYGAGFPQRDFLFGEPTSSAHWIITNPPFRLAERFIRQAFAVPGWQGIAMIVRTSFLESVGRYDKLFKVAPPSIVAQFTERVPMVKGRLTETGSTATAYCWLVWQKRVAAELLDTTRFVWIQPCRRSLERPGDYPADPSPADTTEPSSTIRPSPENNSGNSQLESA
jgi:hypothetical protein